jgi:UDP-glucose 4-epimerase
LSIVAGHFLGYGSGMTTLVTGGAGFMGSHVAEHLLKVGHDVVILDDLSGGFTDNLPNGAEFVEGSILDQKLLRSLFERHRFDYVYHLAAYAAEGLSPFIRNYNYSNNLIGSTNVINQCVLFKSKRLVFTSSIAVYGSNQVPMTEELIPQPEDPYGIAKYAVELDLKCAKDLFNLEYTIFRPHNVYGSNQNIGDRYRNVIGIFMNQIMQGQPLTIFGTGEQKRAFSYIDDVAIPMIQCLELPKTSGEIFNVGADIPYSINELTEEVMKAMDKKVEINKLDARHEVLNAYSDHSKVKNFFPNLPKPVSLSEGISKMANWAKDHGPKPTKPFTNIEIEEKLPPIWAKEFSKYVE